MKELTTSSWVGTCLDLDPVQIESERPLVLVRPLIYVAESTHESLVADCNGQGLEVLAFMKYFCSFYSGKDHSLQD